MTKDIADDDTAVGFPLGVPPDNTQVRAVRDTLYVAIINSHLHTQGYGRLALFNVLPLPKLYMFDLFVADLVRIGEQSTFTYTTQVSSNSKQLR